MKTLAVDAINLRRGGGLTHIVSILKNLNYNYLGFDSIIVYGPRVVLNEIPCNPRIIKVHRKYFESKSLFLLFWYVFLFQRDLVRRGVDLLFVPGGTFIYSFKPTVIMSQNMLPFELREATRYGFSLVFLRLVLLRFLTIFSINRSEGIIFLSHYAYSKFSSLNLLESGMRKKILVKIIPHGVDSKFDSLINLSQADNAFNFSNPMKIIYVSIIDVYKHHDIVCLAAEKLFRRGVYVELHFVGPNYLPSKLKLDTMLERYCYNTKGRIYFHGQLNVEEQIKIYKQMDLILYASSCENLPIILIEGMRTGLPIVCSNRGPMPEVIDGSAVFFDPESVESVCDSIETMYGSKETRLEFARNSYSKGLKYNWRKCSDETFNFLNYVSTNNH